MNNRRTELPADYYLRNFDTVAAFVRAHYDDLLREDERALLHNVMHCSSDARRLFVRLLMRKGQLFRRDQLDYADITDIDAAAQELASRQLIALRADSTAAELLALLRKPELAQLTARPASWRRERLLAEASLLPLTAINDFIARVTSVLRLCHRDVIELMTLLFFANTRQTLADFVISELGIMRYENYLIDAHTRFFTDRRDVDDYLRYTHVRDAFEADAATADVITLLQRLPLTTAHPYLARRVEKLAALLLREAERRYAPAQALALYRQHPLASTRERTARLLARLDQPEQAWAICLDMAHHPQHDADIEFVRSFSARLARTLGREALLQQHAYTPPQRRLRLARANDSVELICARHLCTEGDVFYVENALFLALFGLIHWEVLFAPVPAAFVNPYQLAPKDLFARDFLARRAEVYAPIEALFAQPERLRAHALQMFCNKQGIDNAFVNWSWLQRDLLQRALDVIPASHLQAIFTRLWADLEHHRSGLPDLILFGANGYRLIEVKGPGDTLQRNQIAWLRYFAQHDIAHEVVFVRYHDDGDSDT